MTASASLAPKAQVACQVLTANTDAPQGIGSEFGHHPTTQTVQVDQPPACLIWPSINQLAGNRGAALLLVDYPDAISPHNILSLWADKNHIEELGARLTFIRTP